MRPLRSFLFALLVASPSLAEAQDVALPEPVLAPKAAVEGNEEILLDDNREIDLANVVTSAAKGVTTVQEAPAIITVITADEIKSRGFKWMNEVLSTIPGFIDSQGGGEEVALPLVRGVQQGLLLLHDGISMFDPWGNIANVGRAQPLENIKRIEVVTGPGGVLWGANSFLGIVNVISKDAADVNGLEVNAGYGDGPGNKQDIRAYALFGKTFWHNRLKIFQHVSYENFIGSVWTLPQQIATSQVPAPPGPAYYGPLTNADPSPRSWLLTLDGKYSLGPVSLYYMVPVGDWHPQTVFNNAIVQNDTWTTYDRYAILEYKDRFWRDRFGVTAKGYYTQFVRSYALQLFPPSSLFPSFTQADGTQNYGGVRSDFRNQLIQRIGGTVDFDIQLPFHLKALFGGESFYEGVSGSVTSFPTQPNTDPLSSSSAANLPLYCPQRMNADGTFTTVSQCPRQLVEDTSRIVVAAYVDAQWQPIRALTFDGGVRLQQGFGNQPYDLTPLYTAAVVWSFLRDCHLKLNYATGFRPPVVQNTSAAPGGLDYGANPRLKNESSQAFQGELNARLLRNTRAIRELEVRLDYSYTFLDQLIEIHGGSYENSGKRGIHSVEAYAKLYFRGCAGTRACSPPRCAVRPS